MDMRVRRLSLRKRRRSVPSEASWWLDRLDFGEVEFADGLQGLGGGAFVQVGRQCVQPGDALGLHRCQLGDRGIFGLEGHPMCKVRLAPIVSL